MPEEEEEWRPPNIVQKKALKVWAMRDKPPRKNFTPLPRIKRGWMNQKYNNLKIEDVIHFICLDKKKHQQITYDVWMHNYKNKLYPKGIIFLFHLNNIPYGKPWRNLALTKGETMTIDNQKINVSFLIIRMFLLFGGYQRRQIRCGVGGTV